MLGQIGRRLLAAGAEPREAALADGGITVEDRLRASREASAELAGFGPKLSALMADETVTDVLINQPGAAWVDRGIGLSEVPIKLSDTDQVRALAVRLAAACGKRLDDGSPICDGTLPQGSRLHAVLPPVAKGCAAISIRKAKPLDFTLTSLLHCGTLTENSAEILRGALRAKLSGIISGATGSGKTTVLGALLNEIPPEQRIVCIEEVSELSINHPDIVHLQERRANVQGFGAVTMSDLVRAAMRMRPDRIVLGECRGEEVRDVLTALNTGHEGGWATIHANNIADVPVRLAALGALAGMSESAVAAQAYAAFDLFVHIRRKRDLRWVAELGVPIRTPQGIHAEMALQVTASGDEKRGSAYDALLERITE